MDSLKANTVLNLSIVLLGNTLIVTIVAKIIPTKIAITLNRNCFCVTNKYKKIKNSNGNATQEPFAPTIKLALNTHNADNAI
jgi:hypothetical protein